MGQHKPGVFVPATNWYPVFREEPAHAALAVFPLIPQLGGDFG